MEKRNEVVKRIEYELSHTGKVVQPSAFLGSLLKIYDEVYFGKQIHNKLRDISMRTYPNVRIVDPAKTTSVFECDLYVVYDITGVPTTIEFLFSPKMWTSPTRKSYYTSIIKELQSSGSFPSGSKYTMYSCMYVMEYSITHLLMVLWRYLDKKPTRHSKLDPSVYSTNGDLYKFLLLEFFGHSLYAIPANVIVQKMGKSVATKKPEQPVQPTRAIEAEEPLRGLVKWSNNSCFFDSVMMVVFYGSSAYIRDTILTSDISYERDVDGKYVNPFPVATKTSKRDGFQDLFDKTRAYFTDNQQKLSEGKIFCSINLRNALSKVDPAIGSGVQYEPSSVYATLSHIFRNLLLTGMKVSRKMGNGRVKRRGMTPTPFISMFDFVTTTPLGDTYLWDTCKEPILVFYIRQSPWLKRWNESGKETISVLDPNRGRVMMEYSKPNPFGDYILGERYRLFGVVVHSGVAPESLLSTSNGHYTSLIRPHFDPGSWYYYDDMMPSFQKVSEGSVPDSAFRDTGRMRPHMLFYERVV